MEEETDKDKQMENLRSNDPTVLLQSKSLLSAYTQSLNQAREGKRKTKD